jgi:hypothetical protein
MDSWRSPGNGAAPEIDALPAMACSSMNQLSRNARLSRFAFVALRFWLPFRPVEGRRNVDDRWVGQASDLGYLYSLLVVRFPLVSRCVRHPNDLTPIDPPFTYFPEAANRARDVPGGKKQPQEFYEDFFAFTRCRGMERQSSNSPTMIRISALSEE